MDKNSFDLHDQETMGTLGSLWMVRNFSVSNLRTFASHSSGVQALFVRRETELAFNVLNGLLPNGNHDVAIKRTLVLIGPPGVGKSCMLVGWAGFVSTTHVTKTPVLWINKFNRSGTLRVKIVCFDSNNFHYLDVATIPEMIEYLRKSGVRIIVLDGFEASTDDLITDIHAIDGNRIIIACSSLEQIGKRMRQEEFTAYGFLVHTMCSWTLDEYMKALETGTIENPLFSSDIVDKVSLKKSTL